MIQTKSIPQLIKILVRHFNKFIRLRDTIKDDGGEYFICISCMVPKRGEKMHAGHYYHAQAYPAVRFNEVNVNGQCSRCNTFGEGNKQGYREGLVKKYGLDALEILAIKCHGQSKLTKFEYAVLIDEYKQKVKKLK